MIIKLSSSGKQLQVIDDDGNVFGTSVLFLKGLLEKRAPRNFVLMTKMPFKVAKNRFAPSPVYNPDTKEKELVEDNIDEERTDKDAFSPHITKKVKDKKAFEDKEVW